MTEELLPFCECGKCGLRVNKPGNRFILGHNQIGVPKPPRTPEHCANISASKLGIPHSPEHNTAISEGRKKSDVVKAEADRQRGGNDLVWHHVAYDFGRPEALRVLITRKFHSLVHHPKGKGVYKRGYSLID